MGLKEAIETALWAGRKGFQPALILVADGRTNIDLSGQADRARAFEDAKSMAKHARALQIPGILIDMSKRPEAQSRPRFHENGSQRPFRLARNGGGHRGIVGEFVV